MEIYRPGALDFVGIYFEISINSDKEELDFNTPALVQYWLVFKKSDY